MANNVNSKSPFYAAWAILAVMSLTAILMAYWMFWPVTVLRVHNTDILNKPDINSPINPDKDNMTKLPFVKRGDFLRYRITYDKYSDIVGEVQRTLINDRTVTLCISDTSKKRLRGKSQEIDVFIPENIWPGIYKLQVDIHYPVNPLRTIHVRYVTDWFEIR